MRARKYLFFLFCLSMTCTFLVFIIPTNAETVSLDRYFKVTPTALGTGNIFAETSKVGISEFQNLGLYGHTEDSLVYWAFVRTRVIANIFTFAELQTVTFKDRSVMWLMLMTYSCWDFSNFAINTYTVTSHEIESYTVATAAVSGLRLNMTYAPPSNRSLTFSGQNVTAAIPQTEFVFDQFTIADVKIMDLANYTDEYVNLRGDESGVTITDLTRPQDNLGAAIDEFNGRVAALQLGVVPGTVQPNLTPDPSKTGKVIPPSAGSSKAVAAQSGVVLDIPLVISPRVTEARQFVTVRDTGMLVDTVDNNWWMLCGDASIIKVNPVSDAQSFTRTVSVHVYNYNVQIAIDIDGYLYSTVQLSAPVTDTWLQYPSIIKGDYAWDLTLGGAQNVNLGFTSAQNVVADWVTEWTAFFTQFGFQILGLVALVIGITVLVKFAGPISTRIGKWITKSKR